jgi:hypothetical protein
VLPSNTRTAAAYYVPPSAIDGTLIHPHPVPSMQRYFSAPACTAARLTHAIRCCTLIGTCTLYGTWQQVPLAVTLLPVHTLQLLESQLAASNPTPLMPPRHSPHWLVCCPLADTCHTCCMHTQHAPPAALYDSMGRHAICTNHPWAEMTDTLMNTR